MTTAKPRQSGAESGGATDMEKKQMNLYTQELDVLEIALRCFLLSCKTTKGDREIVEKMLNAISEKDEAYLIY